ncbi:MAG: hypothetical protein ACC657_01045 [Thiohalomonadales bacterium]
MKKYIITMLIVWFSITSTTLRAAPETLKADLSKSELCDFAIQALKELSKTSTEGMNKPMITKEQCMAISDEDINNAARKIMESNQAINSKSQY